MRNDSVFEFDHIYVSTKTSGFGQVRVRLSVSQSKMLLQVVSDHGINDGDLAGLFDGIRDYALKRLKISYGKDTDAQVILCGEMYYVEYIDGEYRLVKD